MLLVCGFWQERHDVLFFELVVGVFGRHKLLDSHISAIDDKNISPTINAEAIREIEVAVCVSKSTPLGNEIPLAIELLNPLVSGVADIHIPRIIDGNAPG